MFHETRPATNPVSSENLPEFSKDLPLEDWWKRFEYSLAYHERLYGKTTTIEEMRSAMHEMRSDLQHSSKGILDKLDQDLEKVRSATEEQ